MSTPNTALNIRRKLALLEEPPAASSEPIAVNQGTAILVLLTTIVVGAGLVVAGRYADRIQGFSLMPSLGVASLVVLVGMIAVYSQAYQFHKDKFYSFIALAWLGNAIYMCLEAFYQPNYPPNHQPTAEDLHFSFLVSAFSQVTSICFYTASFLHPIRGFAYRKFGIGLIFWLGIIFGSLTFSSPWRVTALAHNDPFTITGIAFSFWTLIRTGKAAHSRLSSELHGRWEKILPWTFYCYAGIQPLYIFRLQPDQRLVMTVFCVALVIKICNGISAMVVTQSDISRVREELKSKNILEDLGVLTASIQHDLKNPLQNIANYIYAMKARYQADSQIGAHLDKIEEQRKRIFATTQIIETLRGGREYYEKFMAKTSVRELINRSVRAVRDEMAPSNIRFVVDGGGLLYTKAYAPVLQQVFVNVLKNAVEAIWEAERPAGLIKAELPEPPKNSDTLIINISDNGCGIRSTDLPRIFGLFTTRKDQKANSGIGLFISKRLLEFHNGSILVNSQEGVGTTVSISLPVWKDIG